MKYTKHTSSTTFIPDYIYFYFITSSNYYSIIIGTKRLKLGSATPAWYIEYNGSSGNLQLSKASTTYNNSIVYELRYKSQDEVCKNINCDYYTQEQRKIWAVEAGTHQQALSWSLVHDHVSTSYSWDAI